MAPERLLFVNHASTMSGAEFVLAQITRAFPEATAFLFENGPLQQALAAQGLKIIVSRHGAGLSSIKRDRSLLRALPAAFNLVALTAEIARAARRADVVYANSQKAFLLTALALHAVRRPLIWHLHDILDGEHFGATQRRVQIGLANRVATRVVVPSNACADAFVNAGGRRALVTVIPNGVERRTPAPPQPSRAALGLPEGPLVGVFSRLAKWKGQHVVLDALKTLPGVQAIIVGSALFGEDAYERDLQQRVRELDIGSQVTFLGQRSDVMDLMAVVDCVVHPSIYPEPFGLTLVEAMSVGTPVVATDAGAAREILEDGRAGRLVPPGDATALAGALRDVFARPSDLAAQTGYAAERAAERYSVARMQDDIAALVRSLAGGAGR